MHSLPAIARRLTNTGSRRFRPVYARIGLMSNTTVAPVGNLCVYSIQLITIDEY